MDWRGTARERGDSQWTLSETPETLIPEHVRREPPKKITTFMRLSPVRQNLAETNIPTSLIMELYLSDLSVTTSLKEL